MIRAEYVLLVLAWTGWCFLHSLLISRRVRAAARRRLDRADRYWRLGYNLVALATLAPVAIYSRGLDGPVLWRWEGPLAALRLVLLLAAVALFVAGARKYDLRRFFGLRQLRTGAASPSLAAGDALDITGILGVTRHPWYLGGLLVVWLDHGTVTVPALLTDLVLTTYLLVGTLLEERRLAREFGAAHDEYRRRVPMLLPWRWPGRRGGRPRR